MHHFRKDQGPTSVSWRSTRTIADGAPMPAEQIAGHPELAPETEFEEVMAGLPATSRHRDWDGARPAGIGPKPSIAFLVPEWGAAHPKGAQPARIRGGEYQNARAELAA
jgi:hypothetical protein